MNLQEAIKYWKETRDRKDQPQWVKERCDAILALAEAAEQQEQQTECIQRKVIGIFRRLEAQDKCLASIEKRLAGRKAKKEGEK